jgi:hypothetical protein
MTLGAGLAARTPQTRHGAPLPPSRRRVAGRALHDAFSTRISATSQAGEKEKRCRHRSKMRRFGALALAGGVKLAPFVGAGGSER